MRFVSDSEKHTFAFAEKLGALLPPDSLLILSGELGAGKTVFAKGIASGLGISERVTSPTFMLAQEYEGGRLPFSHLDAYRLEGQLDDESAAELGLEEYWQRHGVCLIEWGELLQPILPASCTRIVINRLPDDKRLLEMSGEQAELAEKLAADMLRPAE